MNETMVTVTGNVAGDVIARRVGNNQDHLLVTFRVASSERRWDKASEAWVDGDRFTASVNCWRRLADGARSLTKGDPVVVTGRLSVREYEVEGVKRYMTEINALAVGPDLARCTVTVQPRRLATVEAGGVATAEENGFGGSHVVVEPAAERGAGDQAPVAADPSDLRDGTESSAAAVGSVSDTTDTMPDTASDRASESAADPAQDRATVTGIGAGDRRGSPGARASA